MAAILDLVNFHRFKELEKNEIPFYSHHYYVPNGNKQKNHFQQTICTKIHKGIYYLWIILLVRFLFLITVYRNNVTLIDCILCHF